MDANQFDRVVRTIGIYASRRKVTGLLAGSAVGGLLVHDTLSGDARKKKRKKKKSNDKKVTLCHNGQTITVSKKALKAHLAHGDSLGECPPPTTSTTTTTLEPGCDTGLTLCGTACVDLRIDNDHCGACGQKCTGGKVCADRLCWFPCEAPSTCEGGQNTINCEGDGICVRVRGKNVCAISEECGPFVQESCDGDPCSASGRGCTELFCCGQGNSFFCAPPK